LKILNRSARGEPTLKVWNEAVAIAQIVHKMANVGRSELRRMAHGTGGKKQKRRETFVNNEEEQCTVISGKGARWDLNARMMR
jgi:hypothetical protein